MSKMRTKKKRSKPYTGADAAGKQPVVHRYSAVQRNPLSEWWHEKRRPVKIIAIITGIIGFLGWLIVEAVRIIF